jgi:hypothetical protein
VPNSPSRWKVSPIQLDFSAFVIEIPHRQIILRFSRADCLFFRLLLNSEHTKLPSMHLCHHDQISYCTNYTILKKESHIFYSNNDFNAFNSRVPQIFKKSTGTKVRNCTLPTKCLFESRDVKNIETKPSWPWLVLDCFSYG